MFDFRKILKMQSLLIDQEEDFEVNVFGKNLESFYINDHHVPTELIYEMDDACLIRLAKMIPLRTIIRIPHFNEVLEGITEHSFHWEYSKMYCKMFSSFEISYGRNGSLNESKSLSSQFLADARLKKEMKDVTQDCYEYKVIDPLAKDSLINPCLTDWLFNIEKRARFGSRNSMFLVKRKT